MANLHHKLLVLLASVKGGRKRSGCLVCKGSLHPSRDGGPLAHRRYRARRELRSRRSPVHSAQHQGQARTAWHMIHSERGDQIKASAGVVGIETSYRSNYRNAMIT